MMRHANRKPARMVRMTRVRIALAAVVAAALLPAWGVFVQVASNPEMLRPRVDPLSRFERHLAPLREALGGERAVGYLPPSEEAIDRVAHLYSVRYALAPVKVLNQIDLPLVVADGYAKGQPLPPQLRVRRDFGDGLLLLEPAR
jgi:hypothetical protein